MSSKNFKKEIYGNPNWINGRINRAEYIIRIILLGITFGVSVTGALILFGMGKLVLSLLVVAFSIWIYWRIVMTYVKRLHDLGWNGCLALLPALNGTEKLFFQNQTLSFVFNLVVLILSLLLLFRKGNTGANRYGKDPLMKYEENQ